jgi:hypothetical protein
LLHATESFEIEELRLAILDRTILAQREKGGVAGDCGDIAI